MQKQPMVYSKEHDVLGIVTKMDFVKGMVSFEDEEGTAGYSIPFEGVVFLYPFGEDPDGTPLFDGDVFESHVSGSLYEAELMKDGSIQFHLLDEKLQRLHEVDRYPVDKFLQMLKEANTYEVIGSKYELEPEKEEMDFSFNIKVVKSTSKKGVSLYYYACNNKTEEQIDLIKVVFVGSELLKEEEYERDTMTYKEYEELLNTSVYAEASPSELQSYAMSKMDSAKYELDECDSNCDCDCPVDDPLMNNEDFDATEEAPKDYDEAVAYCNECDREADKCQCELWQKR